MENNIVHGEIFANRNEIREILSRLSRRSGAVVVKEESGLKVYDVKTIEDGDYERDLKLAKAGARVLNPGKKVEIIMAWQ